MLCRLFQNKLYLLEELLREQDHALGHVNTTSMIWRLERFLVGVVDGALLSVLTLRALVQCCVIIRVFWAINWCLADLISIT